MKFVAIFILNLVVALNATRELNDKSLNFIKDFEQWRSCGYTTDGANRLTIGYGHLLKPGEPYTIDTCITEAQGLELLQNDLAEAIRCIERNVRVPLTDNQFGALVSWAFNAGSGGAARSTLVRKLNAGSDANEICAELRRWNKVTINGRKQVSNGLVRRRDAECTLYKS